MKNPKNLPLCQQIILVCQTYCLCQQHTENNSPKDHQFIRAFMYVVCMYVMCTHTYIHTYMYMSCMYVHTCMYVQICMSCVCVHTYMQYTCTYLHVFTCIYMYLLTLASNGDLTCDPTSDGLIELGRIQEHHRHVGDLTTCVP